MYLLSESSAEDLSPGIPKQELACAGLDSESKASDLFHTLRLASFIQKYRQPLEIEVYLEEMAAERSPAFLQSLVVCFRS